MNDLNANDDVSGIFGEDSDGLGDLFPEPVGAPADDSLGDLFGDETPTAETDDSLGDLFGEEEVPETVTEGDDNLGDLFGDEEMATPVLDVPEVVTPPLKETTPEEEEKRSESPSATPVAGAVKAPRKFTPPVLGELTRPTRELELKGKPIISRRKPNPLAKPVEKAPEVTPVKAEAPKAETPPVVSSEVIDEKKAPAVEAPAEVVTPVKEAVAEVAPVAPVRFPVVEAVAPIITPAATEKKEEPEVVAAPEPEEAAPVAVKPASKRTPVVDYATTLDAEARVRLEAQAALERQAARYDHIDSLWDKVDLILGFMAANSKIQNLVRGFELTRDAGQDAEQSRSLREALAQLMAANSIGIANAQDADFVHEMLYDEVLGISVLGPLWRDDNVTEILVDGWDSISAECNGVLVGTRLKFRNKDHANIVARALAARISDRVVSNSNPLVTAELPRARIQFAYGSIVRTGLSLTIRKFRPLITFDKLLEYKSLNLEMAQFLRACVLGKANILVSGGTNTGKTTIVNLLSAFIPDTERVITIEDSFELKLSNLHWIAMQTKEKASADDEVSVSLADILRATLRMRPDRIIVGEIREHEGAEVMIQAANTGHEGTMTTIHANSGEKAINQRLAHLLREGDNVSSEVARETVASAFQLVVQITRARDKRYISEISVVDPTCSRNGSIIPEPIYLGRVNSEGEIEFMRAKSVRSDTDLYNKLIDAGIDISEWEN